MLDKRAYGIAALAALLLAPVFADDGPTFIPDVTFKGSTLAGWHVLGQADWKAQNGEVVGTVKPGGSGGWLVLDHSYQDVELFTSFRCTGGSKTGILFRATKTADGMKGIYLSLNEGDVAMYRVTLGADGQELSREPLRSAGGGGRSGPPNPAAAGRGAPRMRPRRPEEAAAVAGTQFPMWMGSSSIHKRRCPSRRRRRACAQASGTSSRSSSTPASRCG